MSKKINQISVGEAQRVEIIKILTRGADIIILDEPTAVLTPQETRRLFEILENLRKDGKSIVFISHKLNEVMEISDRITVMRQGCFIGTVDKQDTSPSDLARMMIGREVFLDIKRRRLISVMWSWRSEICGHRGKKRYPRYAVSPWKSGQEKSWELPVLMGMDRVSL